MPFVSGLRDVAIIVLAIESIVIGVMVIFVLWQTWRFMGIARTKLGSFGGSASEVLDSAKVVASTTNDTVKSVKRTADFVGDTVVSPVIDVASAVAGAARFATALVRPRSNNRREPDSHEL